MDEDDDSCLSDFETEIEKSEGENWKVKFMYCFLKNRFKIQVKDFLIVS